MRKYCITVILVLICLIELRVVLRAEEIEAPVFNVIFSEIFLGSANSGSEEFIEIYNTTDETIDLNSWKIEYFSSSSTDLAKPTRTINLAGEIAAHKYYLISSSAYQTELTSIKYTATLSQTGGSLRLTHGENDLKFTEDAVAWGTAKLGLGDAIIAPNTSQSLIRLQNDEDAYEPTLNNIDDFKTTEIQTPLDVNLLPESENTEVEEENPVSPEESGAPILAEEPKIYPVLEITEMLPNPAEPASDSEDEFIEIYNPHQFTVDMSGYVLKTGLNGTYKHTFSTGSLINPGEYLVVTSKDSSLTLSNTAGKAVLLSPDGTLLYETAEYQDAPEGQAYILDTSEWKWTITPTPAIVNIYNPPPPPIVKSKAKKATTAKAKKAKSTKKTAAKSKTTAAKINNSSGTTALQDISGPVHPLVLAGIGTLTVVYAGYEYRSDIRGALRKFGRNGRFGKEVVKIPKSG